MVESRCGLLCKECEYRITVNCGGCIGAKKPFWAEKSCPIKVCCESKREHHCGSCEDFPCDLLLKFSYSKSEGDNGQRIEQCKQWVTEY